MDHINFLKKVIVFLPNFGSRTSLGLELVAISRAINAYCIAFGNVSYELNETENKKLERLLDTS